jgi:hypothetical protein
MGCDSQRRSRGVKSNELRLEEDVSKDLYASTGIGLHCTEADCKEGVSRCRLNRKRVEELTVFTCLLICTGIREVQKRAIDHSHVGISYGE